MTNTMLTTLIHRSESEKAILECGAKHRFGSPAGDGHNARARLTQLEVTGHSIQSAAARRTPKAPPYPRASTLGVREGSHPSRSRGSWSLPRGLSWLRWPMPQSFLKEIVRHCDRVLRTDQ